MLAAALVLVVQLLPTAVAFNVWDLLLPLLLLAAIALRVRARLLPKATATVALAVAVISFRLALGVAIPNVELPRVSGSETLFDDADRTRALLTFEAVVVESRPSEGGGARLTVQLRNAVFDGDSQSHDAVGLVSLTIRYSDRVWPLAHCLRFRSRLRLIRNAGNEGEFDWAGWNARRGVRAAAFVWSDRDVQHLGTCAGGLLGLRAQLAEFVSEVGEGEGGPSMDAGAILAALVTGDRSRVAPAQAAAVRGAGMAHALAISGMHLGLLVAAVFLLVERPLRRWRWYTTRYDSRRPAAFAAVLALLGYAALAGGSLSVLRAAVMGLLALAALWRGTPSARSLGSASHCLASHPVRFSMTARLAALPGLRALAWAAIVAAFVAPGALRESGFRLSYAAVTGLIIWAAAETSSSGIQTQARARTRPSRTSRTRKAQHLLFNAIAVSLVCQLATAPLVIQDFQELPMFGFIANLFGAPLVWVTTLSALMSSALWLVGLEGLASYGIRGAAWFADAWLSFCIWFAELPGAVWKVPALGAAACALLLLAVLALLAARVVYGDRRAFRRQLAWAAAAACAAMICVVINWRVPDRLSVDFLSVGQGDATVVRAPSGAVMVVDAGLPGRGRFAVGPWLRRHGIWNIDLLVATHADLDHSGGLEELVDDFTIGQIWLPRQECLRGPLQALARFASDSNGTALAPTQLPKTALGPEVVLHQLWPQHPSGACRGNNESLVLMLESGGRRVLLTADIEAEVESELLKDPNRLRADVLKLPHHGSSSSSTAGFLDAVASDLAVVSLGWRNRFGFPHAPVLDRLRARSTALRRSDHHGSVRVEIDRQGTITVRSAHRQDFEPGDRPQAPDARRQNSATIQPNKPRQTPNLADFLRRAAPALRLRHTQTLTHRPTGR